MGSGDSDFSVALTLDVRIHGAVGAGEPKGRRPRQSNFVCLRNIVAVGWKRDSGAGCAGGVDIAVEPGAVLVLHPRRVVDGKPAGEPFVVFTPARLERRPAVAEQVVGRAETRGEIVVPVRDVSLLREKAGWNESAGRIRRLLVHRTEVV